MARPKKHIDAHWHSHGIRQVTGDFDHYYVVGVTAEVDSEPGRMIDIPLSPETARSIGHSLIEYADRVALLNAKLNATRAVKP